MMASSVYLPAFLAMLARASSLSSLVVSWFLRLSDTPAAMRESEPSASTVSAFLELAQPRTQLTAPNSRTTTSRIAPPSMARARGS